MKKQMRTGEREREKAREKRERKCTKRKGDQPF